MQNTKRDEVAAAAQKRTTPHPQGVDGERVRESAAVESRNQRPPRTGRFDDVF